MIRQTKNNKQKNDNQIWYKNQILIDEIKKKKTNSIKELKNTC
jgi:hypothetical protein